MRDLWKTHGRRIVVVLQQSIELFGSPASSEGHTLFGLLQNRVLKMVSLEATLIRYTKIVILVILSMGIMQPVKAQQLQELNNRLQRIQNELTTLQSHVYRSKRGNVRNGSSASPSASFNTAMARLSNQITQLDMEIRRLTGANEELNHKNSELQTRLDRLSADLDFRLQKLEGNIKSSKEVGVENSASAELSTDASSDSLTSTGELKGADRGVQPFGSKTSPLGSKSQTMSQPLAETSETPEQQYDRAHSLIIKRRDFQAAERVLTDFIGANRGHRLAPNAYYWLGRTYFVRSNFEQAAITFAEGFQRFPKSQKAPATLLNLGNSLSRLGKNREACTTYNKLQKNFREVEEAVKRRLDRERKRSKCLR